MATFRQIHTSFWQDHFVISLTPEEKYFYLYLMTNSKTTQCGIYELPIRVIEFETGYNRETVEKLLERFTQYRKIIYNEPTHEILIKNWMKHNSIKSPKVFACIKKELQSVKYLGFKDLYKHLCIRYGYPIDSLWIDLGEEEEEEKEKEYISSDSALGTNSKSKSNKEKNTPPQFDEFWSVFPRRISKQDAIKTWSKLLKDGVDPSDVIKAAQNYANDCTLNGTETRYIKHPASFLNNERWKDFLTPIVSNAPKSIQRPELLLIDPEKERLYAKYANADS